jgi:hypothetical protein
MCVLHHLVDGFVLDVLVAVVVALARVENLRGRAGRA